MNLVEAIKKDNSRVMRDRVVAYVGANPERFSELVRAYLAGPYRITQRASWPLSYCVEQHPELIRPHFRNIVRIAASPAAPVAIKRNTVRLLQFVDVPRSMQGTVADLCFRFLTDKKESIAVRVFSMTVIAHLTQHHPMLKKELRILLEDQLPYGTPGFVSRANRILRGLKE